MRQHLTETSFYFQNIIMLQRVGLAIPGAYVNPAVVCCCCVFVPVILRIEPRVSHSH